MLRKSHMLMGVLCITSLVRGAASEEPTTVVPFDLQGSGITAETFLTTGPKRYYVPFFAGVQLSLLVQHPTEPVCGLRPSSSKSGVVGIVEGSDEELTAAVAKEVAHLLVLGELNGTNGLPNDLRKRRDFALNYSLRKVIAGDFDRLERAADIDFSAIWITEHSSKALIEFGDKENFCASLRAAVVPASVTKQLASIDLVFASSFYTQEARLEGLKGYVARAQEKGQETHEATILRFNPDFRARFLTWPTK